MRAIVYFSLELKKKKNDCSSIEDILNRCISAHCGIAGGRGVAGGRHAQLVYPRASGLSLFGRGDET